MNGDRPRSAKSQGCFSEWGSGSLKNPADAAHLLHLEKGGSTQSGSQTKKMRTMYSRNRKKSYAMLYTSKHPKKCTGDNFVETNLRPSGWTFLDVTQNFNLEVQKGAFCGTLPHEVGGGALH